MQMDVEEGDEVDVNDMVDLLADVPGATTLIAEIDVMCNAMHAAAGRTHKQLEQRIETLKSEARVHRQRLEESYLRTTAAQHEELELCKAKLAELVAEYMPSNNMSGELELELCDEEWARCRRIAESRAKAGQAHADWLEEYFSQRLGATEAFRDAAKNDFAQDLEAIWHRKSVLTARFRYRMYAVGDDAKTEATKQDLLSMRKELQALEKHSTQPLQLLADMTWQAEKDEVAKLKTAVTDTRSQCKAVTTQLSSFLEECKEDTADMRSTCNAELFAHAHLRQRVLIIYVFRQWFEEYLRVRLEAKTKDFATKDLAISECSAKLETLEKSHTVVRHKLEGALVSRESAVNYVQVHMSQSACLSSTFAAWLSGLMDSRVSSAREQLSKSCEVTQIFQEELGKAEAARASHEKQLRRANNFCDADLVMAVNDKGKMQQCFLVAVFGAWHLRGLEVQFQKNAEQLELKKAECAESGRCLEPLREAVGFAQKKAARRAVFAAVFCSWATQYLQHIARKTMREKESCVRRTEENLMMLQQSVTRLTDDFRQEGLAELANMTPAMKRIGSGSRRNSQNQSSLVSSIAGSTCSWSEDESR